MTISAREHGAIHDWARWSIPITTNAGGGILELRGASGVAARVEGSIARCRLCAWFRWEPR